MTNSIFFKFFISIFLIFIFIHPALTQGYVLDAVLLKSTQTEGEFWVIEAMVRPAILVQINEKSGAVDDQFDAAIAIYSDSTKQEVSLREVAMDEPMNDRQIAELLFSRIGKQGVDYKSLRHRLKLELVVAEPMDTIQPWLMLTSKSILSFKKKASVVVSSWSKVVHSEKLRFMTLGDFGSKKILQCAAKSFKNNQEIWSTWITVPQANAWLQNIGCETNIVSIDEEYLGLFPLDLIDVQANRILTEDHRLLIPMGCLLNDPPCIVMPN